MRIGPEANGAFDPLLRDLLAWGLVEPVEAPGGPNGTAGNGTAGNGAGPNGVPPNGAASNGTGNNGVGASDAAASGAVTNGSRANGSATGVPANGAAVNGVPGNGVPATATATATAGAPGNGAGLNGAPANGPHGQAVRTQPLAAPAKGPLGHLEEKGQLSGPGRIPPRVQEWRLTEGAQRRLTELTATRAVPGADRITYSDHRCAECQSRKFTRLRDGEYLCDPCAQLRAERMAAAKLVGLDDGGRSRKGRHKRRRGRDASGPNIIP